MRYLKILEKLINNFETEIFKGQNFMHYGIYGQISAKKNERDYTYYQIYHLHICIEVSNLFPLFLFLQELSINSSNLCRQ